MITTRHYYPKTTSNNDQNIFNDEVTSVFSISSPSKHSTCQFKASIKFFFSLACYAIYMILFLSYEQYSDWDEFGYVDSDIFFWGQFYQHGLTLMPTWISNYIHNKLWDGITCPFPELSCSVEVWVWINSFIPQPTGRVITYPCWDWSWIILVKGVPAVRLCCLFLTSSSS